MTDNKKNPFSSLVSDIALNFLAESGLSKAINETADKLQQVKSTDDLIAFLQDSGILAAADAHKTIDQLGEEGIEKIMQFVQNSQGNRPNVSELFDFVKEIGSVAAQFHSEVGRLEEAEELYDGLIDFFAHELAQKIEAPLDTKLRAAEERVREIIQIKAKPLDRDLAREIVLDQVASLIKTDKGFAYEVYTQAAQGITKLNLPEWNDFLKEQKDRNHRVKATLPARRYNPV